MTVLTTELSRNGLLSSVDRLLLLQRVLDDGGKVILKRIGTTPLIGQS